MLHCSTGNYLMLNVFINLFSQWIRDSYNYYDALQRSEQAPRAGVSLVSGYIFSSVDPSLVQVGYIMTDVIGYTKL
jgi:hypothetical protein